MDNYKWHQMSDFSHDPYTRDAAYEGASFFEVGYRKGMTIMLSDVMNSTAYLIWMCL